MNRLVGFNNNLRFGAMKARDFQKGARVLEHVKRYDGSDTGFTNEYDVTSRLYTLAPKRPDTAWCFNGVNRHTNVDSHWFVRIDSSNIVQNFDLISPAPEENYGLDPSLD